MTDTATITRGAVPTFDPNTGLETGSATTVHSGPCMVKMPTAVEVERLFGEEQVTATRFIAVFPHDVTGVQVDDVVTVTDSEDADLLAVQLKVVAVPRRSHTLYKGFGCEVVE
jgi:hypothetical protein